MIRQGLCALLVGLALGGGAPTAGARPPVPAEKSDEQLREAALKLNDLTDLPSMEERLKELNKQKDKDEVKRMVKLAAAMQKDGDEKSPPLKYNAVIVLAKLASNVKDYASAEYLYEGAFARAAKLKSSEKLLMVYDGLTQIYGEQKKYAALEEFSKKFLELEGDEKLDDAKPFAMETLIKAKAKRGDTAEALKLTEAMIKEYNNNWYFIQLRGWVQREAGKFGDAVDSYNESIDELEKAERPDKKVRDGFIKNTRYLISGLYVDMNKVDKAADILKALIKDEPERATYYNDLGFIWADAGKNLDEAEKMIRKAIELDAAERKKLLEDGKITEEVVKQENAAYVDSLGWVLYKAGKYEEALKLLLQASKDPDEGNHVEIWDHVADCQLALGQTKEAAETWAKALKLADVSHRDAERRKKVAEKLKKATADAEKGK